MNSDPLERFGRRLRTAGVDHELRDGRILAGKEVAYIDNDKLVIYDSETLEAWAYIGIDLPKMARQFSHKESQSNMAAAVGKQRIDRMRSQIDGLGEDKE